MLQFRSKADRSVAGFTFEGLRPNASSKDLCGQGPCKKQAQMSINRGFFYVWANKIGTVVDESGSLCVTGNYWPCWEPKAFTYQVLGAWPETLWKQRKLATATYTHYLYLTRDGVPGRKRNLEEVAREEERLSLQAEIEATTKRVRGNQELFQKFPIYPEVQAWLKLFEKDAARYPLLLVLAPSYSGKTEFAKALFSKPLELKVGTLTHFPDALRGFQRGVHDGIVLDDVRDLAFLADHQDKLQGKYDSLVEFGSTPGGQCTYYKYLFRTPLVVTANYSTKNLAFLDKHDWLGKPQNRVVVHYAGVAQRPEQENLTYL